MDLHRQAHDIAYNHLKKIRTVPPERLDTEMQILEELMADRIYDEHGYEAEHVDLMKERLGLEQDPDY